MRFYARPLGRMPLAIAYKYAFLQWLPRAFGKAVEAVTPNGFYTPELTLQAYILARKLARMGGSWIEVRSAFGFSEEQFPRKSAGIALLCEAINESSYDGITCNNIEELNQLVERRDFYALWHKVWSESTWILDRDKSIEITPEIQKLGNATVKIRQGKRSFSELYPRQQDKIRRLNRLLLELTYPHICPRSKIEESGFYRKERSRFLARNPLQRYLPHGASIRLNFTSPEDIARLYRAVKKMIRGYSKKHGDASVYIRELVPFLISKAETLSELKQLDGMVKGLIEEYRKQRQEQKRKIASAGGNQDQYPSVSSYVKVLALVFKATYDFVRSKNSTLYLQEKEKFFQLFFDKLKAQNRQVTSPILAYSAVYGRPSLFIEKTILPLLEKELAASTLNEGGTEIRKMVDRYSKKYGKHQAYLELLSFLWQKTGNIETVKKLVSAEAAKLTKKKPGLAEEAITVESLIDDYAHTFNAHKAIYDLPSYVRLLELVLKKVDSFSGDTMAEVAKWDRKIKTAMQVRLQVASLKQETLSAQTFNLFLYRHLFGFIKQAESPEHLGTLVEAFLRRAANE